MIQDTSLFAYARATQNLGEKQKQVLEALRLHGAQSIQCCRRREKKLRNKLGRVNTT